jgi:hypothetical protein
MWARDDPSRERDWALRDSVGKQGDSADKRCTHLALHSLSIWRMKSIYLFAAIALCSTMAIFSGNRGVKTALCIASAALSAYGAMRLVIH